MSTYFDTVLRLTAAALDEHKANHILHAGGLNVSRGRHAMRIGDIAGIIGDFESLRTHPDFVAQALAAYALGGIDVKHAIPATGLMISIRTPKSTIPVHSGSRPMNMLRCR